MIFSKITNSLAVSIEEIENYAHSTQFQRKIATYADNLSCRPLRILSAECNPSGRDSGQESSNFPDCRLPARDRASYASASKRGTAITRAGIVEPFLSRSLSAGPDKMDKDYTPRVDKRNRDIVRLDC